MAPTIALRTLKLYCMKLPILFFLFLGILIVPVTTSAQGDTAAIKTDTVAIPKPDSVQKTADTAVVAVPMNCYKQWLDYFTELGTKPMTDGTHPVVIAFKSKESCHCFMGKVEVAGGKIKLPLMVETEGGSFKTFTELGKKLDPDFQAAQGDGLFSITNGMSVLFQTTDSEYGRVFFYKSLNKNKQMNKEAPSPSELLNK